MLTKLSDVSIAGRGVCIAACIALSPVAGSDPLCAAAGFADVNGDGKADAITVTSSRFLQNQVIVRLSNGTALLPAEEWASGTTRRMVPIGITQFYFADVDGDGKADAISIGASGASVKRSSGMAFQAAEQWSEPLSADYEVNVADVSGDGRADIVMTAVRSKLMTTGFQTILVRLSNGTGFLPARGWGQLTKPVELGLIDMPFVRVRDLDGDHRADLLEAGKLVDDGCCNAFVHKSQSYLRLDRLTGQVTPVESFGAAQSWPTLLAYAYYHVLADVTGDGKADLVKIGVLPFPGPGAFGNGYLVSASTGTQFAPMTPWTADIDDPPQRHVVDITGDGAADAVEVEASGIYVRRSNFQPGSPGTAFLTRETWSVENVGGNVPICF
jgi:hypothetical protein